MSCWFSRINSVNLGDDGGYWIVRDFLNYDLWKDGLWLWKDDYQNLIWNYPVIDIDCESVLLIYIDMLNWIIVFIKVCGPNEWSDQIRGHIRPMSVVDPVIEHGGACSGLGMTDQQPNLVFLIKNVIVKFNNSCGWLNSSVFHCCKVLCSFYTIPEIVNSDWILLYLKHENFCYIISELSLFINTCWALLLTLTILFLTIPERLKDESCNWDYE